MKCFRCGADVAEGLRFCGHCGAQVSDADAATVMVQPPEQGSLIDRVRLALAGQYEVEEELARGGMGVVFKAREVELRRAVALKVLSPELALNARTAERFKREARMVADLDHPNVVPMYGVGQLGDLLYIAMKYIEGLPLGKLIESQGALPIPVIIQVLRSAAGALAYAHERGIIHRDVKGDNILVDREGRVLVTDFGVALRAADVTLTVDGTVIGTPAFMSPEQCAGKRAGPQSDQYSLGVVAFQMLAGTVPFNSETIAGYIQHHLTTPVPDIRPVRDDMPRGLVDVVNRALAKEPTERFKSTGEMLQAIDAIPFSEADRRESEEMLRRLAGGVEVARVSTRFVQPILGARTLVMAGPRSRRRTVIAAAVGTVLVLGAAIRWTGNRTAATRSLATGAPGVPVAAADSSASAPPPSRPAAARRESAQLGAPAAAPGTGKLRLLTAPPDAEILVDGQHAGVGSLFDLSVPAGTRRIQARAMGYQPYDTLVSVPTDGLVNLGRVALRVRDTRL